MSNRQRMADEELQVWAYRMEAKLPQDVLVLAVENFAGNLVLASSFGAEDVVLIDMLHKLAPTIPVFYLDTNKHFAETYETRDKLQERYQTKFIQVLPQMTLAEQEEKHGEKLWETDPNLCCQIRKVEPLQRVLSGYDAWITGIRRDQAPTRAHAKKVEWDDKFNLVKFNPLADWTMDQVWEYIHANQVPYNPLHDRHYPSIGCSVCTRPVLPGQDPRAGRWAGFDKTECGLHK
ncbi:MULTISPECIES: phosphoadenylyl-sulfate reductase [Brevibacillus]|jgi:phosphoadenosine phosphosulfate reductase|uniref:phosphoadenylyl-sulfate reductase n=1 Tax=Brevibacillus TaxID=55080 RepID=UPI00156B2D18|nr:MULTISPECIES: phosphoadenylyl-sulfate reductase [Brevibacillus]MDH6348538.1 phosphoadenosine phosphosulfate reductase [Brevibacillus sp. 1238]MDR5002315.1 phosphoadenylyl-sulfate reductase [Brevibacillus parabrevis]MED2256372.1 phosphoadenylyl-sulfate reductase [Brevibacillus parabrevis]NRQ53047.1 phosphoadenylyl-sulfate reductase [Brevibacillus sp. HD1.4A]UED70596.1 phosphoadenylyl-sulfate reductase [Brevibacillus sp. HD3.3A]